MSANTNVVSTTPLCRGKLIRGWAMQLHWLHGLAVEFQYTMREVVRSIPGWAKANLNKIFQNDCCVSIRPLCSGG